MKEPSIYEIKQQSGLPVDAKFIGWLIHLPDTDEYLANFKSDDDYALKAWAMSPEQAKTFKTFKKASKLLPELELQGRAVVVPGFDLGRQIIVVTDREENSYKNPLRQLSEKLGCN